MDKKAKIFLIIFSLLLVGGVAAAIAAAVGESKLEGEPQLSLEESYFDFGEVSMAQGLVKKSLKIKNVGSGDLKISKMMTSCMCTSVALKVNDKLGPEFSMPGHDAGGSLFWSEVLKPGEEGELEIVFDPNAHGPDAVGPVTRNITIYSNDKGRDGSAKIITFEANVIKGEVSMNSPAEAVVSGDGEEILTASRNGVEVKIDGVKKENGKTILDFTADNHIYDLSNAEVQKLSSLAGVKPTNYEIKEIGMGGHHVEARLEFGKELSGSLVLSFNKDLIFNLAIR